LCAQPNKTYAKGKPKLSFVPYDCGKGRILTCDAKCAATYFGDDFWQELGQLTEASPFLKPFIKYELVGPMSDLAPITLLHSFNDLAMKPALNKPIVQGMIEFVVQQLAAKISAGCDGKARVSDKVRATNAARSAAPCAHSPPPPAPTPRDFSPTRLSTLLSFFLPFSPRC